MSAVDALIIALADGATIRVAAAKAGMRPRDAEDKAREYGWPNRDDIRDAAAEIRERHAAAPTEPDDAKPVAPQVRIDAPRTTTDLPGGDPVPPRTKHEPIPVEPDVEDAITRGARQAAQARAALDRDHVAKSIPGGLDPVTVEGLATSNKARDARAEELLAERAAAVLEEGQPQPAVEATDEAACAHAVHHLEQDQDEPVYPGDRVLDDDGVWGTAIPCPGCSGASLVLDPDVIQPGPPPAGMRAEALMEDTAAVLQLLDRVADSPTMADRSAAVQTAAGVLRATGIISRGALVGCVGEIITLADYIVTGYVVTYRTGGDR